MKFKAKSMLAMAVLLSVLSVGTMAEAEFKYKVDDGTEQTWDGSVNLNGTGTKLEVWSSDGSDYTVSGIYGGYDSGSITISGKTVFFNSGTVNGVYGGESYSGKAMNNTVNISGGTVQQNVYGGNSFSSNVTGNIVNISGGTVQQKVYGGNSFNGEVSGNKVIVSGGDLSSATVYGYSNTASSHSNNTLQIENSVTIREIHNFENISFVLPSISGNTTILNLTNAFSVFHEICIYNSLNQH